MKNVGLFQTSIFFEEYWYPGQQVKGVLNDLSSVTWLNPTLLYNARNVQTKKNSTFYATVEKANCVYLHLSLKREGGMVGKS